MVSVIAALGFFGVACISAYNRDYLITLGAIVLASLWFKEGES